MFFFGFRAKMGHTRGWLRQPYWGTPSLPWWRLPLQNRVPMWLTRTLFMIAMATSTGMLKSQCDLVITDYSVQVGCQDHYPTALVYVNGGTPPYTFQFETNNGHMTTVESIGPSWYGHVTNGISPDYNATLLVTDGTGCTATASQSWVPHWPIEAVITASETCDGFLRFDWNGTFRLPWLTTLMYPACGTAYNYTIGFQDNTYISGSVAADWTATAPGQWRYEVPLASSATYIFITLPGTSCDMGYQVQCFEPVYIWNLPVVAATGCQAQLSLRAALAGALPSGTLMTDHLRVAGAIPTSEPYSALGYTYVGTSPGASIALSMLAATGNNAIVDWVVIELRSASSPGTVTHSRPALLQRDGDVVGLNGQAIHTLPFTSGNYHIALRHRNHLGVMTATPRALNTSGTMVDFTLSSTATYGTNARVSVNGTMAMPSGDTDGTGSVSYTGTGNDRDVVLQAIGGSVPTNILTNVYDRRDVNLDGKVMYTGTGNDRDVILQSIGGTVPTAVRSQQLP